MCDTVRLAVDLKPGRLTMAACQRRDRDAVNKRVMADPMMAQVDPKDMPFDSKRMFWGGFKEIVRI